MFTFFYTDLFLFTDVTVSIVQIPPFNLNLLNYALLNNLTSNLIAHHPLSKIVDISKLKFSF